MIVVGILIVISLNLTHCESCKHRVSFCVVTRIFLNFTHKCFIEFIVEIFHLLVNEIDFSFLFKIIYCVSKNEFDFLFLLFEKYFNCVCVCVHVGLYTVMQILAEIPDLNGAGVIGCCLQQDPCAKN